MFLDVIDVKVSQLTFLPGVLRPFCQLPQLDIPMTSGYRLVDTAAMYRNEESVGKAKLFRGAARQS
jgi:hypothetical protein